MHRIPSRESARKPRENIETLNMDSRSRLSSIKLMEETDFSVQTYSFLEVTAVRYDEKCEKDRQRCDIRDIVARRNVLCSIETNKNKLSLAFNLNAAHD